MGPLYGDNKNQSMETSNFFTVSTAEPFSRCHIDNKVDRKDTGAAIFSPVSCSIPTWDQ